MKYYVITVDDGSKWGVPAEVIAQHRANYYEGVEPGYYQDEFDAMMHWFDTGDFEFADWAKNNMGWDDISQDAIKVGSVPKPDIDWQECWVNGEYEYSEVGE